MTIERSIIDAASRLRRHREAHLIATVVRVKGSAYRKPGARMLLTQFRWIAASVSGGCLEGDIASKAWWRTRDGEPIIVTYDSTQPENEAADDVRAAFGIGCDGAVEVMLERGNTPGRLDPLEIAERCLRTQKRGAIVTVIQSRVAGVKVGQRVAVVAGSEPLFDPIDDLLRIAMVADARAVIASGESLLRTYSSERGSVDVFVEPVLPPPRAFVFGTGHDAVPVVQMMRMLGWDVSVCAPQPRIATRQRFSSVADELLVGAPEEIASRIDECDRAVAIVMNHHYDTDRENLAMLLATRVRYIGMLGPRTRTRRMLDELEVEVDTRLHAPVGLELGAETPQEIALAIAAEVQSVLRRAPAASRRDNIRAIHERKALPAMPLIAEAVEALVPLDTPALGSGRVTAPYEAIDIITVAS
jgi:xanthine/CO dehydrogenase XdhC/CoxF family maturation factor